MEELNNFTEELNNLSIEDIEILSGLGFKMIINDGKISNIIYEED